MGNITISTRRTMEVTVLSNRFIDYYMPEANGEFVKVYLYLLRILSQVPASFSLPRMADHLNCTERDVVRALKYWEKEQLLALTTDEEACICGILLLPIPGEGQQTEEAYAAPAASPQNSQVPLPKASQPAGASSETAAALSRPKIQMTRQRRAELSEIEDIKQLLFLAEQYLGKTLSTSSVDKLLYFYDNLKFSVDLIEYLIESCVSKGHQSMRYIETVAFAWADKGITTVEQAKKEAHLYNQEYYAILKALGITNRSPVETEIRIMDTWRRDYGFSLDIIAQACSRTVLQTGQASFQYADKILSDWKKKGVKSSADIEKLDLDYQRKKNSKNTAARNSSGSNRFNNFHQRDYDFNEYEKRLLNQ